jgi:hypothetical protein
MRERETKMRERDTRRETVGWGGGQNCFILCHLGYCGMVFSHP